DELQVPGQVVDREGRVDPGAAAPAGRTGGAAGLRVGRLRQRARIAGDGQRHALVAVQVVVRALEADYERVAELVEVRRVDPPRAGGGNRAEEERVRLILDGAERDRSVAVSGRRLLRAAGRCRGDRARPVDRHGEGIGQAGAARVANGQPQLGVVGAEPGGDVPACPEKPTPVPRPGGAVRTPPAARHYAKRNAW